MCWACNPMCGRCKPPQKHSCVCLQCGMLLFFSREEALGSNSLACSHCGADVSELAHVSPVFCEICADYCAFPCKQYQEKPKNGPTACNYRTPPALSLREDQVSK